MDDTNAVRTSSPPREHGDERCFPKIPASMGNVSCLLRERQFRTIVGAFERHGGLARGDELAGLLRGRIDQPISWLARSIVDRTIISIAWQRQTLVPLVQFDRAQMTLRATVARVIGELSAVFDDWELALWFAEPSGWLQGHSPVDLIGIDPDEVHRAAMADRFIARG